MLKSWVLLNKMHRKLSEKRYKPDFLLTERWRRRKKVKKERQNLLKEWSADIKIAEKSYLTFIVPFFSFQTKNCFGISRNLSVIRELEKRIKILKYFKLLLFSLTPRSKIFSLHASIVYLKSVFRWYYRPVYIISTRVNKMCPKSGNCTIFFHSNCIPAICTNISTQAVSNVWKWSQLFFFPIEYLRSVFRWY